MDSKEDWKQNYINAIDRKVSMSPLKKTATRPSFENRRNFDEDTIVILTLSLLIR